MAGLESLHTIEHEWSLWDLVRANKVLDFKDAVGKFKSDV